MRFSSRSNAVCSSPLKYVDSNFLPSCFPSLIPSPSCALTHSSSPRLSSLFGSPAASNFPRNPGKGRAFRWTKVGEGPEGGVGVAERTARGGRRGKLRAAGRGGLEGVVKRTIRLACALQKRGERVKRGMRDASRHRGIEGDSSPASNAFATCLHSLSS